MSDKTPPDNRPIDASIDDTIPDSDREATAGDALTRPGLPTAESDDLPDNGDGDSGDSIFDQIRQCHPNPQAATERLDDLHFATLGLRTNESRLHIIRTATKRSAGALASVQVSKPSTINECHLARVITSAYRVMDPRYRIDRHQQVQLGRILPFELESVTCKSFSQEIIFEGSDRDLSARSNVLFPESQVASPGTPREQLVELAIDASDPQKVAAATTPTHWVQPHTESLLDDLPPRNESELVLEEMRANRGRLKRWMSEVRTLIGLSVLCLSATFYLAYWLGARQANQSSIAVQDMDRAVPVAPDATEPAVAEIAEPESNPGESVDSTSLEPASNSSVPAVKEVAAETPAEDTSAGADSDVAIAVNEADPAEPDAGETDRDGPDSSMTLPSALDSLAADATTTSPTEDASMDAPANLPAEPFPTAEDDPLPAEPRWTEVQISEATQELWDETERATRSFRLSEAAGLIDQWELIAELAGSGSLEHIAAMRLSLRASWLAEPFETTCRRAEDLAALTAAVTDTTPPPSADSTVDESLAWSDPMIRQLIDSWRACRLTISTTDHLNHLLLRSNELLDQLILNNEHQWCSSFGFDAERLIAFTTDEVARSELEDLLASMKTLPTDAELDRMRQSEASEGVLGRTLCLQLRRWDEGLPLMCKASDSRLASASKAEMQWRESSGQGEAADQERGELGVRWSKIAGRYGGRDAASIRLHALDLLDGLETFADERAEILDLLPHYLNANLSKASASQSRSGPVRLSRLR
ncbi:MAG: hypothetical protein ACF8AM_03795 [Rhodopirellula sp. JB055]|uniref:hypothetical protein n=1 Tax=Rhodopirellula sp. JB055 TaxID=3342846 RepID=UPI00370AC389